MLQDTLVKYPRTRHLPWSPGATNDDKIMKDTLVFKNLDVVVLEKRDGENTTMYPNHIHARSLDSKDHRSRHFVKRMHAEMKTFIPEGWRICGENLHYKKSIHYKRLKTFFEVFSIWNDKNVCLSWRDTLVWCDLLDLTPVPVLYKGPWDEDFIQNIKVNPEYIEGYVVRPVRLFDFGSFPSLVGKYVRADHVQTDEHWMSKSFIRNKIIIR